MDRLKQGLAWAVGWLRGFWNREAGGADLGDMAVGTALGSC